MSQSRPPSTRPPGSGPPPGPPRQTDLDASTDAGGPGGGLLGLPRVDGGRDCAAQPPTHRDPRTDPGHPGARAPPPEANPLWTVTCAPARRAGHAARPARRRPAAGPDRSRVSVLSVFGSPEASRCPRQPMGVGLVAAERQRQRRPGARSGGACGPFRAALKTYGKFSPVFGRYIVRLRPPITSNKPGRAAVVAQPNWRRRQ